MVDRFPRVIARAADEADVAKAIAFARNGGLPLAVRGGGHKVAGSGACDNGVLMCLGDIRSVRIDPDAQLARVGGGALWSDVDAAGAQHGLHTTGGLISHTGVGGLTLGGGIGWLMRKHGLTCDNLVGAYSTWAGALPPTTSPRWAHSSARPPSRSSPPTCNCVRRLR